MGRKVIFLGIVLAAGLAVPVQAELVGYWKLEEGTGVEFWDQTDFWHDGKIDPWNEAKVKWSADGYRGGCLDFVSATDPWTFADAPLPAGVLDIQEATYAFWMNMPKTFQTWGPIFVLLGGSMDHSIEPDGPADLYISSGNVWFGTKNAKLNDGQWHHVAVTYSQSGHRIIVYIDGKSAANSAADLTDPISAARLGGPRNRNQWRRYIGRLDEVAVWNQALSPTDIQNVYWFGPQWKRFATNPQPANAATVGTAQVTLKWTPGETAAMHHLYISRTQADVQNSAAAADQGLLTKAEFAGGTWELGKTYYWRVDEVEADGTTVYPGTVWKFTVSAKLASQPSPANSALMVDPNTTLSWTAGSGALFHDVYLGTSADNLARVAQGQTGTTYSPALLQYGTAYYWRVDERNNVQTVTGDVWSFETAPEIRVTDPNLVGYWNFDQDKDTIALDWSGHDRHGEILGSPMSVDGYYLKALSFDGVDDCVEVPQAVTYDFTLMAWLLADTLAPSGATAREGSGLLWSDHAGGGDHFTMAVLGRKLAFETGPGGNPNTISTRDVVTGEWVHTAVTRNGAGQVEIFIDGGLDTTGDQSTVTRNVGANPRIAIGANTLDGRYFKGLIDEVRVYNRVLTPEELGSAMRGDPRRAWNPRPAVGDVVDVRYDKPLSWSAGEGAVQHDVYLGTDKAAVQAATSGTAAIYQGRQTPTTFSPAEPLLWNTTYYWRVDEIDANETAAKGNVWTFRVADYLIVDDFESYVDDIDSGGAIFQTWIDGWSDPAANGATVGYSESPFAERTVVHAGRQSMPLAYDGFGGAPCSEAERTWNTPQDWTIHDLDTLTLYVQGRAENDLVPLYITIKDAAGRSGTATNADANVVRAASWQRWPIPLATLTPVDLTHVKSMVIGLGNRAKPVSGLGTIFIDDIRVEKSR